MHTILAITVLSLTVILGALTATFIISEIRYYNYLRNLPPIEIDFDGTLH